MYFPKGGGATKKQNQSSILNFLCKRKKERKKVDVNWKASHSDADGAS